MKTDDVFMSHTIDGEFQQDEVFFHSEIESLTDFHNWKDCFYRTHFEALSGNADDNVLMAVSRLHSQHSA